MKKNELTIAREHAEHVVRMLERLESPEGAERPLVTEQRSGGVQGDAEQRSAESPRVTPGEADGAMLAAVGFLSEEAQALYYLAACARNTGSGYIAMQRTERADKMVATMKTLSALLRKPDSDA